MAEEWGPWVEWRGGAPCPVPLGAWIEVRLEVSTGEMLMEMRVTLPVHVHPTWFIRSAAEAAAANLSLIHAYRIRKPRGLKILEGWLTAGKHQREDA